MVVEVGRGNFAPKSKSVWVVMDTLSMNHRNGLSRNLMTIVCLVILADWLPCDEPMGLSLAVFILAIGVGTFATTGPGVGLNQRIAASGAFIVMLMPLAIQPGWVPISFGLFGAAYLAVAIRSAGSGVIERIIGALRLILSAGWRIMPDVFWLCEDLPKSGWFAFDAKVFIVWIAPLGLGGVFLLLFAAANPLISDSLSALGPLITHVLVSPSRVFGWILTAALVWPFIVFPTVLNRGGEVYTFSTRGSGIWTSLLGGPAVLRCLVLFNLLFMVQTSLDLYYLWGPGTLPGGLSYAAYAHRGAYPLILTALLTALFSIVATKPGTEAARSRMMRILVLIWIVQNLLLVISSIQRLHIYILAYSLTSLRFWAFVWMCLVGVGLISILLRMLLHKPDAWVLKINMSSLITVLYVGCFVNVPAVVSVYDVRHCLEVSHAGVPLDLHYLEQLARLIQRISPDHAKSA